ncbi:MAG TPA: hypothetical protein VLH61_09110 [Bacteroidales bacterium]|nr:hypothetical protein [Bacteroidales bacterium]
MTFKKDSWSFGIILGIVVPVIVFLITMLVLNLLEKADGLLYHPNQKAPALAGIAANLLFFRYYLVNLKFDKTGRGIILVSFVFILAIFLWL